MEVIDKDITTVDEGVVCHQVNCQGKMGSGVAKAIRDKWPCVFDVYKSSVPSLGDCQMVEISADSLFVANLAGQDRYGYDGKQYTNYHALSEALSDAADFAVLRGLDLYIPYGMGCGLGGGSWERVTEIIEDVAPDAIVCKHE